MLQMFLSLTHMVARRSAAAFGSLVSLSASLAEELNGFFARFKVKSPPSHTGPPASDTQSLTVREHEVRQLFRAVNPWKATGPDGVSRKVLRACAFELAGVFTNI